MLPPGREPSVPVFASPRERPDWTPVGKSKDAARTDLLRKARVWTVTLGRDGKLAAELDAKRIAALKLAA